ncbi:hypothetical protein [Pseudomonas amygdali]|uniref:Uncharacterized protein n=2 Tax=Pseudomonas amygdali pv. lachrymans TaxID=53707 RepID=A0ABR5KTR6_PSEAV|nr:hypothetical protein [Pseudomonas amygdali]AXH59696.1 hypothetical protein PLA107_031225 [Pseudomonas amygdali pv. lachrymans str. M301315]KPC17118.1 Uncharacterized protein AC499_0320 [Pseudomonas amygdali pv. lachrymans]KPC18077.1 Uncharacterized protein AC499_1279 [Pseudomonas amygdali pv. lachrymans]RMT05826.1 hypothetical protein ALP54_03603 [Pseudomonas amygdali pv. lachrymans]
MLKQYSIPAANGDQTTLLWPIQSLHGDIAILKINLDNPERNDLLVQAIALEAIPVIRALACTDPSELVIQVTVGDKEDFNLVGFRHTPHWEPGLIWHRGTKEDLAYHLGIDDDLFDSASFPVGTTPEAPSVTTPPARRYLLLNEDDIQVHFDWPVQTSKGKIALITVREPYKTEVTPSAELTIRVARVIFERFGVLAETLVTRIHRPRLEHKMLQESWSIASIQWKHVRKTSTPDPDGVWHFVGRSTVQSIFGLTDDDLANEQPYFTPPSAMPAAQEIMSPQRQLEHRVEQDADILLNCLERISGTLQQGRSVGFQVALSENAAQMLITRHGQRAEKALANCQRI